VSEPSTAGEPLGEKEADERPMAFDSEMTRLGRVLRAARGDTFSIEALAQRSGVSAGLISQIERGIGNPSFQTLLRVAKALGISLADLLETGETAADHEMYVVRKAERRTMTWPKEKISFELLTPHGQREVSVLRSMLPPQRRYRGFYSPKYYRGTICLLSMNEMIMVEMDDGDRVLYPGDTLTCRSELILGIGNPGAKPAELITITAPGGL
jgi:transcriptional regulator with XRE-family HTH domain